MTTTLTFDWHDGPSATVVAAVATELGVEPEELNAPLNDFVDPDALDALFAPTHEGAPRPSGHVSFGVHGCEVTVHASGEVVAEQLAGHATTQGQPDGSATPS